MNIMSVLRATSVAFFFVCTSAFAQTGGLLSQGQVEGNAGSAPVPASPTSMSAMFDSVFGNSCGTTVSRAAAGWVGRIDGINIKACGAVGDGSTDDTAAIQAAIDKSAPGHLSAVANQLYPIIVPPGNFKITQLNATNIQGFTVLGIGSGLVYPTLTSGGGLSVNAMLDMTGSVGGPNLQNFGILGPNDDTQTPFPNFGLLMANSAAVPAAGNVGLFNNVSVSGRFNKAAIYSFGLCCTLAQNINADNYNATNPNTAALVFTYTNIMAATSAFIAISTTNESSGDWHCDRCEAHSFAHFSTVAGPAVILDTTNNMTFTNGDFGAASGTSAHPWVFQLAGSNSALHFENNSCYTDQGPQASYCIGGTGTLAVGLNPFNDVNNVTAHPTTMIDPAGPTVTSSVVTPHSAIVGDINGQLKSIAVPAAGTVFAAPTAGADPVWTATPTLGIPGSVGGAINFATNGGASTQVTAPATLTNYSFFLPATPGSTGQPLLSAGGTAAQTYSPISYPASATSGGITYFSSTTAMASSAALTAHALVLGGGAGAAPTALGSLGTATTVLHGAAGAGPTFGAVALGTDVSGTLPIANGGTGDTGTAWATFTASPACNSGSGTWTTNTARYKTIGKTVFIEIDATLTTLGTCTNNGFNFSAPVAVQSAAGLVGREIVTSGTGLFCSTPAGGAFSCSLVTGSLASTQRFVASGVYESQ